MTDSKSSSIGGIARSVIAPVTITTALLFYFGWLRSQAIAQSFGYDASILGLSPQDYILRSVQPMIVPLLIAAAAGIGWWKAHEWLESWLKAGHWRILSNRHVTRSLRILGYSLAFLTVYFARDVLASANWRLPLLFVLSALLIGYGTWLQRFSNVGTSDTRSALAPHVAWAVVGLLIAAAFVAVSIQARAEGRAQAQTNIDKIQVRAVATLTSEMPLQLRGIPVYRDGEQFIYSGLVLMFTEDGHHFLIPASYQASTNARVYTVPVESARLDFNSTTVVPCNDFDDLPEGASFSPGETFQSAGVVYFVVPFPRGAGPEGDSNSTAEVERRADGNQELRLRGVMIEPLFDAPYRRWVFEYDQRAPGVAVGLNDTLTIDDTIPHVDLSGSLDDAGSIHTDGEATGTVTLGDGRTHLTSLSIGGTDIAVNCVPEA